MSSKNIKSQKAKDATPKKAPTPAEIATVHNTISRESEQTGTSQRKLHLMVDS